MFSPHACLTPRDNPRLRPRSEARREPRTLACRNRPRSRVVLSMAWDEMVRPKLLGGGVSSAALTWAFASSGVKSSGYTADQRKLGHGISSWSQIFCAEKPCPHQGSRRSEQEYLRRVTVTSD